MKQPRDIDGAVVQWGDRLFYPGNRIVRAGPSPDLGAAAVRQRAAVIRRRIEATVVRRVPQVMVKVTGGGRGMKAIVAHLRYISRNGRLEIEDDRGDTLQGKDRLRDLAEDWRFGGTLIDDIADRREAFNVMLSMPRGTDPALVQRAAREFARIELAEHKYVMALHDHQANPHVHISVRAESRRGKRLDPRKADLHRWRETFAERLRVYGVEAEATRQSARGRQQRFDPIWRVKAREEGRLRADDSRRQVGTARCRFRQSDSEGWTGLARALATSTDLHDRSLAASIDRFVADSPGPERTTEPSATAPSRDQGRSR